MAFSYSGEYFDRASNRVVGVEDHSGTSDHYAHYGRTDTCSGVVAGATELERLISRLVQLHPNTEVDIVAHSMGGLVSTYLLAVADTELTKHIRSITTLDSPLRGTGFLAPFSACDYQSSNAWNDLDLGSAVIETIATLGETANTNKVSSITSLIGAPLPGEAFMEASCGSINPVLAHSCVWNDANALNAVARSINDSPPSVPRLRWHDLSGSEIDRILEGEIVQLHAPVPGLADGETTATILEVDTLDADDLLGTIKLTVKDGIASAKWRAVWTSDGFGIGGDPEYKFVVGNVSSPQLNVVKLPN